MHVEHLTPADYRVMPWQNGRGATAEIRRHPRDGEASLNFDWRLSLAAIDADGEFSLFPGYDRSILTVDGDGIALIVGDRAPIELGPRAAPHAFPGDEPARCHLLGGPTRDFNVMTRRGRASHTLLRRPLVGPMVLLPEPGVLWAVHVLAGWTRPQNDPGAATAQAGDTLIVELEPGDRPLVLGGSGELALARIHQRTAPPPPDART
jgi:environmental stress-induced protein Ves